MNYGLYLLKPRILCFIMLFLFSRRQKRNSRKESTVQLDDIEDTEVGNVNNAQDNDEVQDQYVAIPFAGMSTCLFYMHCT